AIAGLGQALDHEEAVISACVVAAHSPNNGITEIEIEPLSRHVRGADLETDGGNSAAKKPLLDLIHQPPAVSDPAFFWRDSQRYNVTGIIGLDHSDYKRDQLIGGS